MKVKDSSVGVLLGRFVEHRVFLDPSASSQRLLFSRNRREVSGSEQYRQALQEGASLGLHGERRLLIVCFWGG